MRRSLVATLACLFSVFFIGYVYKLADDISHIQDRLLESENVIDVTSEIETRVLVTPVDLEPEGEWTRSGFDDSGWTPVRIPRYLTGEKHFSPGNFVYYRITVPAGSIAKLAHLKSELALGLQQVGFSRTQIFVNGKHWLSSSPGNSQESMTTVSIGDSGDQLVTIKGLLREGSMGIAHRGKIFLGKGAELNELHRMSYKLMTVFPLVFILSKGSILFLFTMIFLVIKVSPFFDKFLIFGLCAVSEDFFSGNFLQKFLTLNQLTYLFTLVNVGAVVFLFLFFGDAAGRKFPKKWIVTGPLILALTGTLIALDVLYTNHFFTFTELLKFWNLALSIVLFTMLPFFLRSNRILALGMAISLGLTLWSTFFASNVGLNYKAFGSLILFFSVAYETFRLLRNEQDLLRSKEKQLLEQEKDVAIGKTAALLAHDVRRPLEQMKLVLERISSGSSSPEFLESAKRDVEFSLTSVNTQVNDIMNFSSLRNVQLAETSFHRILAASLKQVMTINQNVKLDLHYDLRADRKVIGDESLLAGVLTNLISNAVEAIRDIGRKDQGSLRLVTRNEKDVFVFSITNDGPPIPEDSLDEIWKPLFTMGKEKGTGLGLASVQRAITDQGGRIEVRNSPAGVTFTVTLKAGDSQESYHAEDFRRLSRDYAYQGPIKIKQEGKLRVFILDDDTQVFEYFRFLSAKSPLSLDLTFASSYSEGEKEVSSRRFDLYILDHDLGSVRSGTDFYEQYLPFLSGEVVLHTNRENLHVTERSFQHLPKPVPAETFQGLIEKIFSQRTRIALADDSELVREAWSLFHGEHNLTAFASPEELLASTQNGLRADVFVLDYFFDNSAMNGISLAGKLREKVPDAKIVISSNIQIPQDEFRVIGKTDFEIRKL